jgi:hypothetical protein
MNMRGILMALAMIDTGSFAQPTWLQMNAPQINHTYHES